MFVDLGSFRYLIAFGVAFGLSLYFTPLVRRGALAYGVVDAPDGNLKQHKEATPYLGGIAIYLAFLGSLAFAYDFTNEVLGLLLGASIIVMLGLFDDLKVLTPRAKLAGQLVAALVLVKAGIMIRLSFVPPEVAMPLTLLWLVGMSNAINLVDVSDGLAAGVAAIAGTFLYALSIFNGDDSIAILTLALVASTLGFLAFNRPPAKIYLGDAGSMFLGFMLGALAMSGRYTFNHRVAAVAPLVLLGVPLFDTAWVMAVRARRGLPILQGSPDHFAVRLRRRGWSASRIAFVSYLIAAALGATALALCYVSRELAYGLLAGVMMAVGASALILARIGRGAEG